MAKQERTAVIFGDESKLCKSVAYYLAENAVKVVLIVFGGQEQKSDNGDTDFDKIYAGKPEELDKIAANLCDKYGSIDYYIHFVLRSCTDEHNQVFPKISNRSWKDSKENGINLLYNASRSLIRKMVSAKPMRVLVIGSVTGMIAVKGQDAISYMSAGAFMLVKSLAVEAARHKVTVNAIALGAVDSELKAQYLTADEHLINHIPLKRTCQTTEIFKMVKFLIMDAPDYFTGNVLALDGGLSSAYLRDW